MPPGRKVVLAVLLALPLCGFALFLLYGPSTDGPGQPVQPHVIRNFPGQQEKLKDTKPNYESEEFWNSVDFQKLSIPPEVSTEAKNVEVTEKRISVEGATVFYREAKPKGSGHHSHTDVLLMHGAAFSSKTWLDLGTIQILAAMGYRTIAIDIPGFGNSQSASISDRVEFVKSLAGTLQIQNPVIISPSMSGTYAIPYLLKHWKTMGGYVPVAPVGIQALEMYECAKDGNGQRFASKVSEGLRKFLTPPIPDLSCIKIPTLVVYGERDRGRNSALLSLLPWSQEAEIPNGRHPAYLDNPELWHQLLYNFLCHVSTYISQKTQQVA